MLHVVVLARTKSLSKAWRYGQRTAIDVVVLAYTDQNTQRLATCLLRIGDAQNVRVFVRQMHISAKHNAFRSSCCGCYG